MKQTDHQFATNDGRRGRLLAYGPSFSGALLTYLLSLSTESRSRFGPHPFTEEGIEANFAGPDAALGFVACEEPSGAVVGYALLKPGLLDADALRYAGYSNGILPEETCTFAPSVADNWQGSGLARQLFEVVKQTALDSGFRTMVLWGGTQATNARAIAFYRRLGFHEAGRFEHNGSNLDMWIELWDR
ncbi:MAG: GNAT family N-acetyltransferase [Bacteroidales bacterium]|nr:GNAT family N-acetyltransferase [Bacteroidales bacterium]